MSKRHIYIYGAGAVVAAVVVGALYMSWRAWYYAPSRALGACATAAKPSVCYSERINAALVRDGLGAALEYTAYAYGHNSDFSGNCHGEMHILGAQAYRLFSEHKDVALSSGASICGYGFYHGFMEALLYATHDYAQARSFCAYAGVQVPLPQGYAEGACYHGIGHGVTDGEDPSLWGNADAMMGPGLAMCHNVASLNADWQFRCYSGVFNSMALMAANPKYKLNMHGDPYLLCRGDLGSLERRACYEEMNTLVVYMSQRDIEKTLSYINTISDTTNRLIALTSALAVYGSSNTNAPQLPDLVARTCARYGDDLVPTCVGAFVSGMLETGTPGAEYVPVLALCESATLPERMRAGCYAQLLNVTQIAFSKETVTTICNKTPVPYRATSQTCATL